MADQAEYPQEQLDAVLAAVTEKPGATSAQVAHAVPARLAGAGRPAVVISRDKAKALLRVLEDQAKVTRRTEQARVGFYPAGEETSDARG